MSANDPHNFPGLAADSQRAWEANAAFWDDYMGEANDFQRELVNPAVESLLDVQPGERLLEIACGNGSFSRRMARLGARVTAFDFSPTFIERARKHTQAMGLEVDYRVVDAADRAALASLGQAAYDGAVCNMAIMDMADIQPLVEGLPLLLAPGGRFVFSIQHPCFNSPYMSFLAEQIDDRGDLRVEHSVKIAGYLTPTGQKGIGVIGQPEPHYYFHRPLGALLGAFFRAGFVLDGLEERAFSRETPAPERFSWRHYSEIPPLLAARLRPG